MKPSTDHLVFDVRLAGARPKPWRRFSLAAESTFFDLHVAIQDACGWTDTHLWLFAALDGEVIAGIPEDDPWNRAEESDDPDAKTIGLAEWFLSEPECEYVYDFGDGWRHEIRLVERMILPNPTRRQLLAGKWSFPPEDCGGIPGHQRCVQLVRTGKDPWGEKAADLLDWLNGWRPDAFDLESARHRFETSSIAGW